MDQVPIRLRRYFPDARWEDVDPEIHSHAFMERILEYGTREDVKWLLATYRSEEIRDFIRQKGARRLSKRSLNFWCLVLDVRDVKPHPWPFTADALWGR